MQQTPSVPGFLTDPRTAGDGRKPPRAERHRVEPGVTSMARKRRTRINRSSLLVRVRSVALLSMLVASTVSGWAQGRLGAGFHLQHEDMAVLESGEPRADFSCRVIPDKPELG